ncbi:MAG: VOC family protein [Gaiellaceae bacterium]|jgi:predicted enzyme related to lactoylglutathione lyase
MGKRMVHVEFPAKDLDRGKKFWEGVGGWDVNDSGMPGMQYLMWQEGDQGGGIYSMEGMSGTTLYLGSDDIDADIAKVRELGGEADDKQPIPNIGWFARCKDSEGNAFALYQGDENAPMPEGMGG